MPDFDPTKYNESQAGRPSGSSGLTGGVESGVASVEKVSGPEPEQKFVGNTGNPRHQRDGGKATGENGKSFEWR